MRATETSLRVVRFCNVHTSFDSGLKTPVWALRGIDLEVHEGQALGLLGPNGSGKTTSISCLVGLLEPKQGHVELWGRRPDRTPQSELMGRVGVLLEDTRLPPFLRVRQALEVVCALRGLRGPGQARELERVIELSGIAGLLTRRVVVLSKGQARRVGVAAALLGDPPLLILDEPSAGLDVSARVEFDRLIKQLQDGKRTMIIASHLLGNVEATCTHVAIMREGRILVQDSTQNLLRRADAPPGSDIYVEAAHAQALDRLEIQHDAASYPNERLLRADKPDLEVLRLLLQAGIVPRRMEPRSDLISLYLDVTQREEAS